MRIGFTLSSFFFCTPDTSYGGWAYCVFSSGDVDYISSLSNGISYGSPDIRYTSFWWVDISGAPDSYLHNDVSYSYGNFSPDIHGDILACFIYPHGILLSVDVGYISYGSPDTNVDRAFLVFPFGSVDVGNYGSDDVTDSYGSPHFNDIAYSYYVHLVGYIDVSINVHNSYGCISPDMSSAIYEFLVLASGSPIKFSGSIINASYG